MKRITYIILLFLLALTFLASVAPANQPIPQRDQGVYLYVGQEVLKGSVPYKDLWDHKGPVIYYINALGLLLVEKSYWGVWFIEVLALCVAVFFSFVGMEKYFNEDAAFFGTLMWLLGLSAVIDGGNTVEEFNLPIHFLIVFLFLSNSDDDRKTINDFLIGLLAGISFYIRPNNIGAVIASVLALTVHFFLFKNKRQKISLRLLSIGLGFLLVSAITFGYFLSKNAFSEMWNAVFIYNIHYLNIIPDRWEAFLSGVENLPTLAPIGIGAWMIGAALFFFPKGTKVTNQNMIFILLLLPIDITLSLLSGRNYKHYYIAWLPSLGFFTGFFANEVLLFKKDTKESLYPSWLNVSKAWLYVLSISFVFLQFQASSSDINKVILQLGKLDEPVNISTTSQCGYIENNTSPNDYVMFWGNEVACNYVANRQALLPIIYSYPLMLEGYLSPEKIEAITQEIASKKPIIVNASKGDRLIYDFSSSNWEYRPTTFPVIKYIQDNYQIVDTVPETQWTIWKHK